MSSLTFTVPQFIDHFETRGELLLAANQKCTISGTKSAFPTYTVETIPSKIIYIFNMILLPLAKEAVFNCPNETEYKFNWNEDFSWVFTHDISIKTVKTDLAGKIDDVFSIMIASSRLKLTLEPKQPLFVWGFSTPELDAIKTPQDLFNLFQSRTSYSLGLNFKFSKGTLTNALGTHEGYSIVGEESKAELTLKKRVHSVTVLEFLKHFETNNELTIKDIEYTISGVSQCFSQDTDKTFENEHPKRFVYLLNKILIVLGKNVWLNSPPGRNAYWYDGNLTFSSQFPASLHTSKTNLETRIRDLFTCMLATSRLKIEIAPDQKLLVTGFSKRQLQKTESLQEVLNLFFKYCPPGFTVHISSQDNVNVNLLGTSWYCLEGKKGFTLSLKEVPSYEGLHNFVKELERKGKIEILPGQKFVIRDVKLQSFGVDYKMHFEQTIPFITFLIRNLSILFSDKNICFLYDRNVMFSVNLSGSYLTLESTQKMTFTFMDRQEAGVQTLTSMPLLGDLLILNSKKTFTLPANQDLWIYGLDQKKFQTLKRVVQEGDDIFKEFVDFIQENNPLGYVWTIDPFEGDFHLGLDSVLNNAEKHLINIRADVPMTFRLFRAAGIPLILNLLKHASAATLQAFKEADESVYTFLLFQAFYFYCCEDLNVEAITSNPSFKVETRNAIIEIVKEDEEFKEALIEVNSDDKLYYELKGHLAKTPQEFAKISQDALPEELRIVFSRVNSLVYNELYGSPFINFCLQQVQPILEAKLQELE